MYYVYVLKSRRNGFLYIGMTSNLKRRLYEHGIGHVRSTRSRRPLSLMYLEECGNRASARSREVFLKSGCGREFIEEKIQQSEVAQW